MTRTCQCCGQYDLQRTYIACQHCRKYLCLRCVAVHPSPELCAKRSFQCTHGNGIGRGNDHARANPTNKIYSFQTYDLKGGINK